MRRMGKGGGGDVVTDSHSREVLQKGDGGAFPARQVFRGFGIGSGWGTACAVMADAVGALANGNRSKVGGAVGAFNPLSNTVLFSDQGRITLTLCKSRSTQLAWLSFARIRYCRSLRSHSYSGIIIKMNMRSGSRPTVYCTTLRIVFRTHSSPPSLDFPGQHESSEQLNLKREFYSRGGGSTGESLACRDLGASRALRTFVFGCATGAIAPFVYASGGGVGGQVRFVRVCIPVLTSGAQELPVENWTFSNTLALQRLLFFCRGALCPSRSVAKFASRLKGLGCGR